MKTAAERQEVRVLVRVLRALRNWDQAQLGRATGLHSATICRYEAGVAHPLPKTLHRMVSAAGLSMGIVETTLLPALRQLLALLPQDGAEAPAHDPPGRSGAWREEGGSLQKAVQEAVASGLAAAEAKLTQLEGVELAAGAIPRLEDRPVAEALWQLLQPCTAQERLWLVDRLAEYQVWSLADLLASRSEVEAADDSVEAVELARLGLHVAERCQGDERWRMRLRGYCRAFLANAQRVHGELQASAEAFTAARHLWAEGDGGDPDVLLPTWRLDDLEASLRRDERDFRGALLLLDRAVETAPREFRARILLKRGLTLEHAGDVAGAIAVLREAEPLIDGERDPRLPWVAEFNSTNVLCKLQRFDEAGARFGSLKSHAAALGNRLDLLRVDWLSARIAAGQGRRGEACEILQRVIDEFAERRMAFDVALCALDLAALHP